MWNWREAIENKLAEIDLWAVNQVNNSLDDLSTKTDRLITGVKDQTKAKVEEAKTKLKNAGETLTRSMREKK